MSKFQNDSIFWIEVDKIKPNPYQPRKEFSEDKLSHLAESIRQYGILQPIVVTRHEISKEDGGLMVEYELIAGERRLRASKIAGLTQIPSIIRTEEEDDSVKLELAIIENLQREDLNPIDRAIAFQQLVEEFGLKHGEVAKKVGKSREYVTNTLRLLALPEEMKQAIVSGQITEGHSRPILMLKDRPEEQKTLYKEIIHKRLTVRDAEAIARKIAVDKIRKKEYIVDPEILELEGQLAESLGTRVQIERKEVGGKLMIDFFTNDDLRKILDLLHSNEKKSPNEMMDNYINSDNIVSEVIEQPSSQQEVEEVEEIEKAEGIERLETNPIKNNMEENLDITNEDNQEPKNSLDLTGSSLQESINKEIPMSNISEAVEVANSTNNIPVEDVIVMDKGIEIIKSDEPAGGGIDISKENDDITSMNSSNLSSTEDQDVKEVDIESMEKEGSEGDIYSVKDFNI